MGVTNQCGYVGRVLVLLLATIAISLSIVASVNCEYLYFENISDVPWEGLDPPFDTATKAYVGIFSYKIVESTNPDLESSDCVSYDSKFGSSEYEVLIAAQWCAMFAPIIAGLAIIINLFETCICSFFCSFLLASLLFLASCGVQGGTFSLFAEPDFCFEEDSGQSCDVGVSVYLSGAATVAFWCCCLLLCCFPSPRPLFSPEARASNQQAPARKNSTGPQVIIQPIIVEDPNTFQDDYDCANDTPASPKRKSSKIKEGERQPPKRKNSRRKGGDDSDSDVYVDDGKIKAEDFDELPEIQDGTHVEVKEKTFPDGTRQVDEITHYPDGSKSVKSQTFHD